jgi:hypothetical protein
MTGTTPGILPATFSARHRASEVSTVPDFATRDVDLDLLHLTRQLGGESAAHFALEALVVALDHNRKLPWMDPSLSISRPRAQ